MISDDEPLPNKRLFPRDRPPKAPDPTRTPTNDPKTNRMIVASADGREIATDAAQRPDLVSNDDSSFRRYEDLESDLDLDKLEKLKSPTPRDSIPRRMVFPSFAQGGVKTLNLKSDSRNADGRRDAKNGKIRDEVHLRDISYPDAQEMRTEKGPKRRIRVSRDSDIYDEDIDRVS